MRLSFTLNNCFCDINMFLKSFTFQNFTIIKPSSVVKICSNRYSSFVPNYHPYELEDCDKLLKFIRKYEKIAIVTGAGVSTESGIPDYRSKDVGLFDRSKHKPIQYQEFLKSAYTRKRYWVRNFIGWPRFSQFHPNVIHYSLAFLEQIGKISCIITQNVDHLHSKAGSEHVIELHGTSYRVMCLGCDNIIPRHDFQITLNEMNSGIRVTSTTIRPDGDVELNEDQVNDFVVPPCQHCGGILKPEIIFFGDNVPKLRAAKVRQVITESNALLVLGSSLHTFSGYRIVLQAKEENKEVGMVNIGPTRADSIVDFKISTKCGDILSDVCQRL